MKSKEERNIVLTLSLEEVNKIDYAIQDMMCRISEAGVEDYLEKDTYDMMYKLCEALNNTIV